MNEDQTTYLSRGARAAVSLHARHLHQFVEVWRKARALHVVTPRVEDPDYASLETVLNHVLRWARRYLIWICEQLNLPDPEIPPVPAPGEIEGAAERYIEGLLARWAACLRDVAEEQTHRPEYVSPWGVRYCIDAMLEHAVMHPIRHSFQLEEWLGANCSREG